MKTHSPEGVQDCLPQECYLKKEIEQNLRAEFIRHGYSEVETPAFEYYDVFASGVGSYLQESLIKFFDPKGRILVLKPDLTVPIARMFSVHGGEAIPGRLFYIQNAYSSELSAYGRSSEYTQAGIELIGEKSYGADAEVIALAVRALLTAGLKNFKIDIGQVAFFKALIADENLDEGAVDAIRHQIDHKNMFELENLLASSQIRPEARERLLKLPVLYGGEEVLSEAAMAGGGPACEAALENLRNVFGQLCAYGLRDYISIDLGMLHDIGYYSGIIFRGLSPGIGFPVLSGGRYDHLLAEFGSDLPATGFAMGIKRVMIAMEKQGLLQGYYRTDMVVGTDEASRTEAYRYCERKRAEGKRVVLLNEGGPEAVKIQKEAYNAPCACYYKEGKLCELP